jgi:hypothetical protein
MTSYLREFNVIKVHIANQLAEYPLIQNPTSRQQLFSLLDARVRNKLVFQSKPMQTQMLALMTALLMYPSLVEDFLGYLRKLHSETAHIDFITLQFMILASQPTPDEEPTLPALSAPRSHVPRLNLRTSLTRCARVKKPLTMQRRDVALSLYLRLKSSGTPQV